MAGVMASERFEPVPENRKLPAGSSSGFDEVASTASVAGELPASPIANETVAVVSSGTMTSAGCEREGGAWIVTEKVRLVSALAGCPSLTVTATAAIP